MTNFESTSGQNDTLPIKHIPTQLEVRQNALIGVMSELEVLLGEEIPEDRIRVLYSESLESSTKPASTMTEREKVITKAFKIFKYLDKAVKSDLIKDPQDARDLAAVLLSYPKEPAQTLSYLKCTKTTSLVEEPISPRALINVISIHNDFIDGSANLDVKYFDIDPSLATVIRAAQSLGFDLDSRFMESNASEDIANSIVAFSFFRDIAYADENGEPYHKIWKTPGVDIAQDAIGFAAIDPNLAGRDYMLENIFAYPDEDL